MRQIRTGAKVATLQGIRAATGGGDEGACKAAG